MESKLSKNTLVVVVTFEPEIALLKDNLNALKGQFQDILIVDNHSSNISEIRKVLNDVKQARIAELDKNMGIAYAQNVGLKSAIEKKKQWLLTMDQDSIIPANLTGEYEKIAEDYKNIGLISWSQDKHKETVSDDWFIVSSGCLMNVDALERCNGFDNRLFIDHVDTDVNIKIKNLGYTTLTTNKVELIHKPGTKSSIKTLRGNVYYSHSPIRIYYIIRNGIVIFKRYFFTQSAWALRSLKNSLKEGARLILYQPGRTKNLAIIFRAWYDGIVNRLGQY